MIGTIMVLLVASEKLVVPPDFRGLIGSDPVPFKFGTPKDVAEVLGAEAPDYIKNAVRVAVVRLNTTDWQEYPTKGDRRIEGYATIGDFTFVSEEIAKQIKSLLISPKSYRVPNLDGLCAFSPAAVVRFWGPDPAKKLDLLVCFSCYDILYRWDLPGPRGRSIVARPGPRPGPPHNQMADFEPGANSLARLLALAMPGDSLFKGLVEKLENKKRRAPRRR